MMKRIALSLIFLYFFAPVFAQTATELRASSKTFLQQGDLDNAIKSLEQARQLEPGNIDVLKELAYAAYIKKDYSRAREVAKDAVANLQADAQAYQILGLVYKAIAQYKEAEKLYKTALEKYPDDGLLRNEYGELLALESKDEDAIAEWEKGIKLDPSYSSNYYNAAMYYSQTKNWLRTAVYGEIFVNLESYTKRTEGAKALALDAWSKLLAPGTIRSLQQLKTTTEFEKAILTTLEKSSSLAKDGINSTNINTIRSQFVAEWLKENDKRYPFRLFNYQQQLIGLSYFEAYNQWIFGQAANPASYEAWQSAHAKEAESFKNFQQGRVFKLAAGQYYFGR